MRSNIHSISGLVIGFSVSTSRLNTEKETPSICSNSRGSVANVYHFKILVLLSLGSSPLAAKHFHSHFILSDLSIKQENLRIILKCLLITVTKYKTFKHLVENWTIFLSALFAGRFCKKSGAHTWQKTHMAGKFSISACI